MLVFVGGVLGGDKAVRRRRVAIIRLATRLPEMLGTIHRDMWRVGFGSTSVSEAELRPLDDAMREATDISVRINTELPSLFRSTAPDDLTAGRFDEVYTAFRREGTACFAGLSQLRGYLERGLRAPLEGGGTMKIPFSTLYEAVDLEEPKRILQMAAEQIAACFPVDEAVEASQPAGTVIEEYIMGDKFENINHAIIVNRSRVDQAFNRYKAAGDDDVASALKQIAEHVNQSGNVAAAAVFDQFTSAINEQQTDKSKIRQCWDGLVAILPSVSSVAGAAATIAKLFV